MDGAYLIGSRRVGGTETFRAQAAANGEWLPGEFPITTMADLREACRLAGDAFGPFRDTAPAQRAAFLETIARQLEYRAERLVARAMEESGLPQARLTGELGRTCGQLRLFAQVLREGEWAGIVVDRALPDREPLPRPDLRVRRIPLGPVAVFGASNFPLAFSVAGGDTASALAAGCPVVVKAHSAHPGTSLLAGEAIQQAVAECALHEGVFSLVQGPGRTLGTALVADPRIAAVGFTGSRQGGMALVAVAQARPVPIPVYAEMSSVNPVLLLPGALAADDGSLARGYVASLTLGAGQFCTNPGLVFALAGDALDRFTRTAAQAIREVPAQVMLTSGIAESYRRGSAALAGEPGVAVAAQGMEGDAHRGGARLLTVTGSDFLQAPAIAEEVFGPSSVVVACRDIADLCTCLAMLEGQLTATMHLTVTDYPAAGRLLPLLERLAGRIVVNGWPTGVEVCRAMVHGGPFPATSDPRATSVGALAIERFLRPVCYQGFPDSLLPAALRDANPWALPRRVFG
jgi:NADP-dependent aldehyde dehydrogenase